MGGWLRHRPGDVGVTARATDAGVYTNRRKWPLRVGLGHLCTLLRCCGQPWGRRSVHRSAKMASRCRFGAFVYTVAPGGTSTSTTTACRRRLLAGPSRLVGKPGSERVAPLLGWHLRQDVNPHEPPMDLVKEHRTPRICERLSQRYVVLTFILRTCTLTFGSSDKNSFSTAVSSMFMWSLFALSSHWMNLKL